MKPPFKYLGVNVGGNSALVKSWDETINKLRMRLSKWKLKTLSIGGRLTLLKLVLRSTPIYTMSLYKAPKTVLNLMEAIRRNFFNGGQDDERKIAWVKWAKVLASKKYGGLGVSSMLLIELFCLNGCGDSYLAISLFGLDIFMILMVRMGRSRRLLILLIGALLSRK
nr:RNA-directed DNA polymerase, eukaryota [Tanacetum cinerariifolium]